MIKPNLTLNKSLFQVRNSELIQDNATYLTSPIASGVSSLTVANITGAAVSGYIILGVPGDEQTELVQIHAATSPTGTTITLAAATTYAHETNAPVYFAGYNQVEFSRATTSGGSKSVLATSAITPDSEFTEYSDTTNTTGYGYARFKNSASTTYSSYSDEQAYTSMTYKSVGKIIDMAFIRASEYSEAKITRDWVLEDCIWGFINKVSELRTKWNHEESDADTSNTLTIGGETFSLPSDIKFTNRKGIQAVTVEGYEPLEYISVIDWRRKISGLARSTLDGAVLLGAVTLDLIDASQFPDSGDGYIDVDAFCWSGKTDNQLTGVTGILAHDSGSVAWEVSGLGLPEFYMLQNGTAKLFPAPSSDYSGITMPIDYYKETIRPDSENDIMPTSFIEPCKDWCSMRIAQKAKDWSAADRFETSAISGIVQAVKSERTGEQKYLSTKE